MEKEKFKISRVSGAPVTDAELISDLKRIAAELSSKTVAQKTYGQLGKYNYSTVERRFGSWNKALNMAGLSLSTQPNIKDIDLFDNVLRLWEFYGRQPRQRELALPPSTISESPYTRRFGSWLSSLEAFVEYANANDPDSLETIVIAGTVKRHNTARDPSIRLRWKTLQRDDFKCRACGLSPANTVGVELHVDHVIPWSVGGETVFENLQTLCSKCNLGKSNEVQG